MSTTALSGVYGNNSSSIMPREKSTRQIVREEIQREKALENLEEQHDTGEISDFEYTIQKALLNFPVFCESIPTKIDCVA